MPEPSFISYCIATYKRPELLGQTLRSILEQDERSIEVIVSDNDPEGSSEPVVAALRDPRLRYSRNETNLGMVRNFNQALSLASGTFVVMVTDDDPITRDHGSTLRALSSEHPGHGAYFGVGYSYTEDADLARAYGLTIGDPTPVGTGEVSIHDGPKWVRMLLRREVRRYMLWSCGMVRREIAQQVQMPDYGSPFLTDFAYVALVGQAAGIVVKDVYLGKQRIHLLNFGRAEIGELGKAIDGFSRLFEKAWPEHPEIQSDARAFCSMWAKDHLTFLLKYRGTLQGKLAVLRVARQLERTASQRGLTVTVLGRAALQLTQGSVIWPMLTRTMALLRRVTNSA